MLTWRGSAPPLSEQSTLDIHPAPVERLGAAESLDLHDGVGMIDHQFVAASVIGGSDFTTDHAVCPAEKTHHALNIGRAKSGNRGQNRAGGAPGAIG